MQIINLINTLEELKSYRDHLGKTIENKLGSPLGERKLNEFTAYALGVKDFNTARGIVFSKERNANYKNPISVRAWFFFLTRLCSQKYADFETIQLMLDGLVYDFVGTGKNISDSINNQGWRVQIDAILKTASVEELVNNVISETILLNKEDIVKCYHEAEKIFANNPIHDEHDENLVFSIADIIQNKCLK